VRRPRIDTGVATSPARSALLDEGIPDARPATRCRGNKSRRFACYADFARTAATPHGTAHPFSI